MYPKVFYFSFFITLLLVLPTGVFAANRPSVTILSPIGNEVYKKGEPVQFKVRIDNIPQSGASLWLQEAVYDEEYKTYGYRFVTASDYYFKKSKSAIATIPIITELSPTNTDIRLLARIWKGHYEADADIELASDWNEGPYQILDERGKNLPDFVIEKIEYINPEKLVPGKVAKVKVTVRNIGTVDTSQKLEILTYTHRQVYSTKQKTLKVVPPKVGETQTYTVSGKVNTQSGKNDEFLGLYVELDPSNLISELDDENMEYMSVR